jgi:hypothetical protein
VHLEERMEHVVGRDVRRAVLLGLEVLEDIVPWRRWRKTAEWTTEQAATTDVR